MEELSEYQESGSDIKKFIKGPNRVKGSDLFTVTFNYDDKLIFKQRVYLRPNSSNVTLMSDSENKV